MFTILEPLAKSFILLCSWPASNSAVCEVRHGCVHTFTVWMPKGQGAFFWPHKLFPCLPSLWLSFPDPLCCLPRQWKESLYIPGLKNSKRNWKRFSLLCMFRIFLAVYSARHAGFNYIKILFLVFSPRHGSCSWHVPFNFMSSLVNSYSDYSFTLLYPINIAGCLALKEKRSLLQFFF